MSIIVAAQPGLGVTPAGDTAVPPARDAPRISLVPATAKTAPRRDDRPGRRSLALPGMEATIEVSGLRKRFGPTLALDGMSFTVRPGQVTGFVGPNGAGKSTTMRVILGLDAADEGSALIGGRPYRSLRHPLSQVGALLDAGALQPSRSARNHLLWLAHSQGLGARRVDEVIEQAGLSVGGPAQGGRILPGHAAAAGDRRGAARRPAGADDGRAVQRHGSRGHRVDARVPAVAGRPGPRGAGVQPPDERAAGHRGPPGGGRPRAGSSRTPAWRT